MNITKLFDNKPERDRAVLVGVGIGKEILPKSLDELSSLCKTCGIDEVARAVQNRNEVDPTYYIGSGKTEEIATLIRKHSADCVVFDCELSGTKVRNLERALNVAVLDRSKIILDIFAMRAMSAEGKLQVELAQLKYNMPRLVASSGLLSKMKSAVGMRGPGEKKLELDKRNIRAQVQALETQIKKLGEKRTINRKMAGNSRDLRVCLVGYTNSGKSTLLNTITKIGVVARDQLFATLDAKTARVYLGDGISMMLTDTVGFIDKLPHEFIHAFESTLDETRYSDLLLHIVDVSNIEYKKQVEVVREVLRKIGADNIPVLYVLNKIDKLSLSQVKRIEKDFPAPRIAISASQNVNIDSLKELIMKIAKKTK